MPIKIQYSIGVSVFVNGVIFSDILHFEDVPGLFGSEAGLFVLRSKLFKACYKKYGRSHITECPDYPWLIGGLVVKKAPD